jgi:hypothetical protein
MFQHTLTEVGQCLFAYWHLRGPPGCVYKVSSFSNVLSKTDIISFISTSAERSGVVNACLALLKDALALAGLFTLALAGFFATFFVVSSKSSP